MRHTDNCTVDSTSKLGSPRIHVFMLPAVILEVWTVFHRHARQKGPSDSVHGWNLTGCCTRMNINVDHTKLKNITYLTWGDVHSRIPKEPSCGYWTS
jgi:hypothetical protein